MTGHMGSELAAVVARGYQLDVGCRACAWRVVWGMDEVLERFPRALRAKVSDVAGRLRCQACDALGARIDVTVAPGLERETRPTSADHFESCERFLFRKLAEHGLDPAAAGYDVAVDPEGGRVLVFCIT